MVEVIKTESEFKQYESEFFNNKRNGVLYFYAVWCNPCKALSPVLDQYADTNDKLIWAKVNTETTPTAVKRFNIKSVPSILFFKDGQMVNRINGSINVMDLENRIAALV